MRALGNIRFWPVTEEIAERSAGYRYGVTLAVSPPVSEARPAEESASKRRITTSSNKNGG